MERVYYPPGEGPFEQVAKREAAARDEKGGRMSRKFIEDVAVGLADRFKAETKKMRGEIEAMIAERFSEFLAETRKLTKEHGEIRDRQVDSAVQAAIARVERDLRTFVTQRVDRAMADVVEEVGRGEKRKKAV